MATNANNVESDLNNDTTSNEPKYVLPKNIGHLLDDPMEFDCPACHQHCMTVVANEAVTLFQKLVCGINFCLCCSPIKWSGRYDVNHYCSKCGCYIGRKIELSWYKRKLFEMHNSEIRQSFRWQNFDKIEKERLDSIKNKHRTNEEQH